MYYSLGLIGYYWSASHFTSQNPYQFYFTEGWNGVDGPQERYSGHSVRLVRDVE